LLAPATLVLLVLLVLPILSIIAESFRQFVPGHIGGASDAPLTLENYLELADPTYLHFFWDTFRVALLASVLGIGIGFPIAYTIARQRLPTLRKLLIGLLITLMFLSVLVRVYSLALSLGPMGFGAEIASLLGLSRNSRAHAELMVIAGLLHYVIPLSALMLIGTIQNVNPRLAEVAMSLGANACTSHLSVTVPLSVKGIASAFLVAFTLSISSFVIPMVLGAGQVMFVSNLIYRRFGEVANYPSGSAISLIMLAVSLLIVYAMTRLTTRWDKG
jgi:putative spermidine/putrescine transport system permease protein